jgi:hypothetical protein
VERARIEISALWQERLSDILDWPLIDVVNDLHRDLEDAVVAGINGLGLDDFPEAGATLRAYVGAVADRLMPRAFVAQTVRYRDPFVRPRSIDGDDVGGANGRRVFASSSPTRWEPEIELGFDRLRTESEPGGVAVRTPAPDSIEIEGRPVGGSNQGPDSTDLDIPVGDGLRPFVRAGGPTQQQAMLRQVEFEPSPQSGGPLVHPFDAGIWTMDHQPRSPLAHSGGSPRDPSWYGLSTNCVVATSVYRSLREGGLLERTGTVRSGGRTLAWRVEGCADVAADFSGHAPDDAPGLALAQLVVGIGPDLDNLARWQADVRVRLRPRHHGWGCLSDAAVQPVLDGLACVEAMTGGEVPESTRIRQLEFRGFVFLGADLTDRARDIQLVSLQSDAGIDPPSDDPVHTEMRDTLAAWLAELPEVPVLYNPFRSIPGATDRSFFARSGWLCIERRYRFPDLTGLKVD